MKFLNFCWCAVIFLNINVQFCFGKLSCKDDKNRDVDWYVMYKIPKISDEREGTNLGEGTAYAYITSSKPGNWKLSSKSVTDGSLLENTLEDFNAKKKEASYLFYNDDPPEGYFGTAVGHLKGVLAFDAFSGFWLIHSIPRFGDENKFEFPENAMVNGQSILCVTFHTKTLNEICNQLLYCHPNIYSSELTDEVAQFLDDSAKSIFTDNPAFIRKDPLTRAVKLKSLKNKSFVSFAKDNQFNHDLYSDVIAPGLKSSLVTETWRRGSGMFLPASCKSDYSVLDIVTMNMTVVDKKKTKNILFKSTEDHSKWAASAANDKSWICVGDMNRMASQAKRGGGALCFESAPVWNAYRSAVSETDQCPGK
ncbi:deoxyribonuclease-2-like [Stegodyphus dumicola]|uniref:deoxyribonuclease-2-like n=1 Tax=Stegodyphus dumicola TaxID=202533 RepID=UPI0015A9CEDC|nr:deoxyribonuclease-2-like [Stegodyphus dumicola]